MANLSISHRSRPTYNIKRSLQAKQDWLKKYESMDYPGRVKTREYYQALEAVSQLQMALASRKRKKGGDCV